MWKCDICGASADHPSAIVHMANCNAARREGGILLPGDHEERRTRATELQAESLQSIGVALHRLSDMAHILSPVVDLLAKEMLGELTKRAKS